MYRKGDDGKDALAGPSYTITRDAAHTREPTKQVLQMIGHWNTAHLRWCAAQRGSSGGWQRWWPAAVAIAVAVTAAAATVAAAGAGPTPSPLRASRGGLRGVALAVHGELAGPAALLGGGWI